MRVLTEREERLLQAIEKLDRAAAPVLVLSKIPTAGWSVESGSGSVDYCPSCGAVDTASVVSWSSRADTLAAALEQIALNAGNL